MNTWKPGVWIFLIFLILVTISPVEASGPQKRTISMCGCSSTANSFIVQNEDIVAKAYTISPRGEASSWVTLVPSSFTLAPGDSKQIYYYLKAPCKQNGIFDLAFDIAAGSWKKALEMNVFVDDCVNFMVNAENFNQTTFPCTPTSYAFSVENIGTYTETFYFSTDKFREYVRFSSESLIIPPKAKATVLAYVHLPCEISGNQNFNLISRSAKSRIEAKTPVNVFIEPFYNYSFKMQDYYLFCELKNYTINPSVNNQAYIENLYYLSIDGPEWVSYLNDSVIVSSQEKGKAAFYVEPPAGSSGIYNVTFKTRSYYGDFEIDKNVVFNITECFLPDVEFVHDEISDYCGDLTFPISLRNNGRFKEKINLELLGGDFAWLTENQVELGSGNSTFIYVKTGLESCNYTGKHKIEVKATLDSRQYISDSAEFDLELKSKESKFQLDLLKRKFRVKYDSYSIAVPVKNTGEFSAIYTLDAENLPEWAMLDTSVLVLEPGQVKDIMLNLDYYHDTPENDYEMTIVGYYNISLIYSLPVTIALHRPNVFEKSYENTLSFVIDNWYYILAGVIVLVLAVWFIIYLRRKLTDYQEQRKRRKGKDNERKFWIPFSVFFIAILLILAVLMYYFDMLSLKDLTTDLSELKAEELNDSTVQANVIEPSERVFQRWAVNTELEINLNSLFLDEDGDLLNFSSTDPDNIGVNIDPETGITTLVPKKDWSGKDSIIFTADDNKGGITSSPELVLVVEKNVNGKVQMKEYFIYLIVFIIILYVFIRILFSKNDSSKKIIVKNK